MADEENQQAPATASSTDGTTIATPDPKEHGYSGLAKLMGEFPELAVYRRFGKLNCLNLLLLQAELDVLEEELRCQIELDNASPDLFVRLIDKDFLIMSGRDPNVKGRSKQYSILLRIRQVLRQYNREMLIQSQLDRFPRPTGRDVDILRKWKNNPSRGDIRLQGRDCDIYETLNLPELQSVHAERHEDAISDWLVRYAIDWYDDLIGCYYKKNKKESSAMQAVYSEKHIIRIVSTLTIALSSVFPVASIIILNKITKFEARLYVIVGFTILFAAVVGQFTGGKRVETFAATMAFAAVQVVFISNNNPPPTTKGST